MPADRNDPRAPLARRRFLGALALAPAALAGCAGAAAARPATPSPAEGTPAGTRRAAAPDAATAAVREQPLAAGAEPAFVFRAAAARPGEP